MEPPWSRAVSSECQHLPVGSDISEQPWGKHCSRDQASPQLKLSLNNSCSRSSAIMLAVQGERSQEGKQGDNLPPSLKGQEGARGCAPAAYPACCGRRPPPPSHSHPGALSSGPARPQPGPPPKSPGSWER